MTDAIVVRGANKHYGDFAALDNIDYQDTTSDPQAVSPSQWSSIAMHRG